MEKEFKYKGYIGSISYSDEDGVFYGKIEGILDLVNYESETKEGLRSAFEESVDYYLDFCKSHNKKPEKSFDAKVSLDLTPETQWGITQLANKAGMSFNAFVRQTLDKVASTIL